MVATIKKIPAPDNHFTPAPHCRVIGSCSGRVRGASAYPIVRAGIVSAAGVENAERIIGRATPDDHFAARPDCRVILSAIGRASGSYPGIIGASSRPIRYCGKRIVSTRRCHYLRHLVFRSGSPGLQRLFAPFNRSELQPVFGFLNYCRRVVTPLIFLQGAQYSGFDLRYRRGPATVATATRTGRLRPRLTIFDAAKHGRQFLHVFVPLATVQLHAGFSATVLFLLGDAAPNQFDFAVIPAGLFHLPDGVMRPQISFCPPFQLAVKSLVVCIEVC